MATPPGKAGATQSYNPVQELAKDIQLISGMRTALEGGYKNATAEVGRLQDELSGSRPPTAPKGYLPAPPAPHGKGHMGPASGYEAQLKAFQEQADRIMKETEEKRKQAATFSYGQQGIDEFTRRLKGVEDFLKNPNPSKEDAVVAVVDLRIAGTYVDNVAKVPDNSVSSTYREVGASLETVQQGLIRRFGITQREIAQH